MEQLWNAMRSRHSVRRYLDRPIEGEVLKKLQAKIAHCSAESGLSIQYIENEPAVFAGLASYGFFTGVRSYLAFVGVPSPLLEETVGRYGEELVLYTQTLGLSTCWVGGTYSRKKCSVQVAEGEKLVCLIVIGYGENPGRPHKNRPLAKLCTAPEPMPDWFAKGMEAALLAPTAINQQKFHFTLKEGKVLAEETGGPYSKVDLGIVKYHFELGAGKENFAWAEA